jgi:transcriptional regulator with XRE-family HTH domain
VEPKELKERRQQLGLSVKDAAQIFKVTYSAWGKWERGERQISGLLIAALSFYEKLPASKRLNRVMGVREALKETGLATGVTWGTSYVRLAGGVLTQYSSDDHTLWGQVDLNTILDTEWRPYQPEH